MGIFNKDLPDELKNLGLSPAEIVAAINAKKELETKMNEKDAEIARINGTLSTQQSEYEQTKARLTELEANSNRQQPPKAPQGEEQIDFVNDPEGAVNQRIRQAVTPVALVGLNAAKTAARMEARNSLFGKTMQTPGGEVRLQTLWDRWIQEIEASAAEMNIIVLGNSLTWLNLFDFIKGKHMAEMMAKPETFVESVQTNTNVRVGDHSRDPEKLNDEELRIAKRMKVTPEQYLEQKKKMRFSPAA